MNAACIRTAMALFSVCATIVLANQPDVYSILGREVEASEVHKAYAKVFNRYILDPVNQELRKSKKSGAQLISGTVEQASGQFAVIRMDSGELVAVRQVRETIPETGKTMRMMVVPTRVQTYQYRDATHGLKSIPHYTDASMTLNDFVRYLRLGAHFPEARGLGTKKGQKGLFSTRPGEKGRR